MKYAFPIITGTSLHTIEECLNQIFKDREAMRLQWIPHQQYRQISVLNKNQKNPLHSFQHNVCARFRTKRSSVNVINLFYWRKSKIVWDLWMNLMQWCGIYHDFSPLTKTLTGMTTLSYDRIDQTELGQILKALTEWIFNAPIQKSPWHRFWLHVLFTNNITWKSALKVTQKKETKF